VHSIDTHQKSLLAFLYTFVQTQQIVKCLLARKFNQKTEFASVDYAYLYLEVWNTRNSRKMYFVVIRAVKTAIEMFKNTL